MHDRRLVPITPATKVADLLEAWPELEEVLVSLAPAFRRLRNPVLRRTVARVATLEQAAGVGGVSVRELVAALRRAAGLEDDPIREPGHAPAAQPRPGWVDSGTVRFTLDAEALLDAGQVPLGRVNELARELGRDEILRLDSSFRPLPLVEALEKQGYLCFVDETAAGRFTTWVTPGPAQARSGR